MMLKNTLLLFVLTLACLCSKAQQDVTFPCTFTQQILVSDVNEGVCALSGMNDDGEECFLQALVDKKKNKLKAIPLSVTDNKVMIEQSDVLWKIIKSGNYVLLYSPKQNKYLARKKENTVQLELSSTSTDAAKWSYALTDDGRLKLTSGNRILAVGQDDDKNNYFGAYTPDWWNANASRGLMLFTSSSTQLPKGINVMPQQGEQLCICSSKYIQTQQTENLLVDDYLLCDGSIAPFEQMQLFTAEVVNEQTFRLKAAQGYLSYNLTTSATPYDWQILNGAVCTTEVSPRYICWQQGACVLYDVSKVNEVAMLRSVANAPQMQKNDNGVYTFSGGWSAQALQTFIIDPTVRCLDFTALSLPIKQVTLATQNKNIPIFVNDWQPFSQPWRFVVKCSKNGNQLVDAKLHITDKMPLFTDRSFSVTDGQVVYEREFVNAETWQTLSLPYSATLPKNVYAFSCIAVNGDTINCEQVSQLQANQGYLVKADVASNVQFLSISGEVNVTSSPASTSILRPNFELMNVAQNSPAVYMVRSIQNTFNQAAIGSKLSPFRAYLLLNSSCSKLAVRVRAK